MAARDLSAGMLAAIEAGHVLPALLYEGEFNDGSQTFLRLWTGVGTLSWDSKSWTGGGKLLEVSVLREKAAVEAVGFSVKVSGIPSTDIALALTAARRNLPGRVYLALFEPVSYLELPGVAGNYASTPDSAAVSVTGDIDVRIQLSLNDWTPSATANLFAKRVAGTQESWRLVLGTTGFLSFVPCSDGVNDLAFQSASAAVGFTNGTKHWLRVTRVAATGVMNYYTSEDGADWLQLGSANRTSTPGNIFDSNSAVEVGSMNAGGGANWGGKVYRAQIYNGIAGTLVADLDPRRIGPNSLTGVAATGETWTAHQSGTPAARIVALPDQIIADPYLLKRGRFSMIPIEDDGVTATIAAKYEDRLIALNIPRERRYTHQDQQIRHPGDKGFDQVEALQDANFQLA